ncbi:MAG TPA: hypothetical protein VFY10_16470 [Dehalococcoidia bacterium]|nr:hypothetical protein [Dehalococcoidia bacterium]
MTSFEAQQSNLQLRRLQLLLLLMILWDLLALLAEISFGGPLMKVSGDHIGGFMAAKTSMSGAALVPICLYLYALARNPMRHRGVLWAGVVEQAAAAAFAVYHLVASDIKVDGMVLPLVVSAVFLLLLLVNMPRAQAVG